MLPFATEFPVKKFDTRAEFIAEITAWLRGMENSTVLSPTSEKDLDGETAHLLSASGEELRLRQISDEEKWSAIGFRHDFTDCCGRTWRTEGVLKYESENPDENLIRFRTQCLANTPEAHLTNPKKPYLIKSLIKDGRGGCDAELIVNDQPLWLEDTESALNLAQSITLGTATKWLPVVYVSAVAKNQWLLSQNEISKLAYDLGGIAHIVVEPDRSFSFRLRDKTSGNNVYGGSLGLSVPKRGFVGRYPLGWQTQNGRQLIAAVKAASIQLRGQMPSLGWDWTELQERALHAQRARDKNRLTAEEEKKLDQEEIKILNEKIDQLNLQIAEERKKESFPEEGDSEKNFKILFGTELYTGEIYDRLRYAAKIALIVSDQQGLDQRSKAVLENFRDRVSPSPALNELVEDLKRATRDPNRAASELKSLLGRHGYQEKSNNKHIRLEANDTQRGLDTITIPKTPSDHRALKNLRKQIEHSLGIDKLIK